MSNNDRPTFFELYKIAIETRNFEIELFWKRSNYFLVLNTALAVGFFHLESNDNYRGFIAFFGILVSWLWIMVVLGSRYWQIRWEEKVNELESKLGFLCEDKKIAIMFSAKEEETRAVVKKQLSRDSKGWLIWLIYAGKQKWLKRIIMFIKWLDKKKNSWVIKKPSVSNMMFWLSLLFTMAWVLLLGFSLLQCAFCN